MVYFEQNLKLNDDVIDELSLWKQCCSNYEAAELIRMALRICEAIELIHMTMFKGRERKRKMGLEKMVK